MKTEQCSQQGWVRETPALIPLTFYTLSPEVKAEVPLNTVMKSVNFLIYYKGRRVICSKTMPCLCTKASSAKPISLRIKPQFFRGQQVPPTRPHPPHQLFNLLFYHLPLARSTSHVIFLLFLQHFNLLLTTWSLHLLSPLPGMLFPQIATVSLPHFLEVSAQTSHYQQDHH